MTLNLSWVDEPMCLELADRYLMPIVTDKVRRALAEHIQRTIEEWILQHEKEAEDGSMIYDI